MTALPAPKPTPNQRRPAERSPRWSLREVRLPQRKMASIPFVLSLGVLLALGMVGLLLLNTALQEQGFAVQDRQKAAAQLGYKVAALETEVTEARSSAGLAVAAAKLGMVPNPYPVYLSLPSGDIIGNPTRMTGNELPDVRYRTPEELAKIAQQREEDLARAQAEAEAKKAEAEARKAEAAAKKAQAEADKKAAAEKKAAQKKAEAEKKAAEKKKAASDAKAAQKKTDKKKESGR